MDRKDGYSRNIIHPDYIRVQLINNAYCPEKWPVNNMLIIASTVMKYQGKTAIPLIVTIGGNPRRTLSISMFLVMMSRVTKDSDLCISPIHDLSHLLKLEWS